MIYAEARPLPIRVDEIDCEWLTRALRMKAPGTVVNDMELLQVIPGTCTKIRLQLNLNDSGKAAGIPERVILKGGFETHSREMSHVHLAEVRGYRDLFPFVDLSTPACFFADYDEERQQGIVIMEDLVARGVKFCSVLRPQAFEQVALRLTALARFHAQTWQSPEYKPGGRWQDIPEAEISLRTYMDQYLLKPQEWQRFVDLPRGAACSVRLHDLKRIIAAFDRLTAFSRTLPHSILHGDTHPGNLFIWPNGMPGFLDSLPGRGPVMMEVAYHVTGALDSADRRRWEMALVQHYLDELRRNGVVDAPSFDDAMLQYRAFLLNGHIIFLVNESVYQPEAVNTAYTARFSAAICDHGTLELIESLR